MLRFDTREDFMVPDAFVYLCSATRSAPVNLTPIYHLGRERVKKMVILRGCADPDDPQGNEEREAIKPGAWLVDFARDELGLIVERDIRVIDYDADGFAGWESAVRAAVELAGANRLPILANLSSGTKHMTHAVDHFLSAQDTPWLRLFVGKQPASVTVLATIGNRLAQMPIDWEEQPPFETLLDAAEVEVQPDERLDDQRAHFASLSNQAAKLFEAIQAEGGWDALRVVNIANKEHGKKTRSLLLNNYLKAIADDSSSFRYDGTAAIAHCGQIYAGALGDRYWRGGDFGTGASKAFLTGGWFEQYVLDRVLAAVGDRDHFAVRSQVRLQMKNSNERALEIDVLLQQDAVFHLIEAKTSTTMGGLLEHAKKLAALNRAIAGRPARSWIVAPFIRFQNEDERNDVIDRCAALFQVQVLTGADAVDRLVEDIAKLN